MSTSLARRLFELVEPVAVVTYMADEPTEAVMALGVGNVWDAYFAGRAAPLGRDVPPEVVHALFYNFAAGEVARHIARLWHGANLLREHRGDGHVAALVTVGIGGTEAHVLHALSEGMPPEQFGRVSHLPRAQLAAVVDTMRTRGLVGADGWLTAAGRQTKEQVETLTDELAAPAYDILEPNELHQLIDDLEPLAAVLVAASSQ